MIQFNVTPTRVAGHPPGEALIDRTAKWWTCADARIAEYGDLAVAVEGNVVADVFLIAGHHRDPAADNKVVFDLTPTPAGHVARAWIGRAAPVPWEPGQRQPFKYIAWRGLIPLPDASGT